MKWYIANDEPIKQASFKLKNIFLKHSLPEVNSNDKTTITKIQNMNAKGPNK